MKLTLPMIPAMMAAALFAQGPGAPPPRPGGLGQAGPMTTPPGDGRGPEGRMGMRGRMGRRDGGAGGFRLGRFLSDPAIRQQLGVSTEQAAKIRQQELDFSKAEIRNRADLQIRRLELNELLAADRPDRSAVDSKLQEVGAAQLAQEKSAIDNRLNMRDALTPAQRLRLQQLMAQRFQPVPGGAASPRGPQGGGRGGRGAVPPITPGQARPNQ